MKEWAGIGWKGRFVDMRREYLFLFRILFLHIKIIFNNTIQYFICLKNKSITIFLIRSTA